MAKLAHLKALCMYSEALLDYASSSLVPEGFRRPSCAEIIAADKAALSGAFKMVGKGQGDLQTCLVHVAKPGGIMQALLQPKPVVEKRSSPVQQDKGTQQANALVDCFRFACPAASACACLMAGDEGSENER